MKRLLPVLAILLLFWNKAISQAPQIEWDKTIGGPYIDNLTAVLNTSDGGYILSGNSESTSSGDPDFWVIKLSSAGLLEWDQRIGGSSTDIVTSLQQSSDGGYILGGWSNSNASGDKSENSIGLYDFWVVKLSSTGLVEWDKTIGGSLNDQLYSLQQTRDGGYILGGRSNPNVSGNKSENSKGDYDYWVVKLSPMGVVEWDKTIGASLNEHLYAILQIRNGDYILGGFSNSNISGDKSENSKGTSDYWVVKLSSRGRVVWDKTIGGSSYDLLYTLQQTNDKGYILGGTSGSNISGDKSEHSRGISDYWVVKLSPSGQVEWDKTIGGSKDEFPFSVKQTEDGGYIFGGSSNSNASGDKSENSKGSFDYWLVRLSSTGTLIWDKTIGGSRDDLATSLALASDDGYILGGRSNSNASGNKSENSKGSFDYWVVKLSGDTDDRIAYEITGAIWSDQGSYRPIPWLRGRTQFSFAFFYDEKSEKPIGSGFIRLPKAPMYFRKSTLETLRFQGQRTILTGSGTVNMEGNYTFSIDYKDGYRDLVRIIIRDEAGEIFFDTQYGDEEGDYPTSIVGDFDSWFTNEGLPGSTMNDSMDEILADETQPRIYPNPSGANGFTYRLWSEENQKGMIQIFDMRGIEVFRLGVEINKGLNEVQIKRGLDNGNYLMRLSGHILNIQERLIVMQ